MNIDNHKKPAWAGLYRWMGTITVLLFTYAAVQSAVQMARADQKVEPQAVLFVVGFASAAVASFVHFYFLAWCTETFADIRHYTRETAIALRGNNQERLKYLPNESQEH